MGKIIGIDVVLHQKTQTGVNAFNEPIYSDSTVTVSNVLVAPTTSDDVVDENSLVGRKEVYTLAIPKGDTHDWKAGKKVSFFGADWRIIGIPTEGIEEMIPLDWNKKVQVERYEQG
jgi:hypothetical protein